MITYQQKLGRTAVYLDGRLVGNIVQVADRGFVYHPVGGKATGEYFPTLRDCQRSLEDDDDATEGK